MKFLYVFCAILPVLLISGCVQDATHTDGTGAGDTGTGLEIPHVLLEQSREMPINTTLAEWRLSTGEEAKAITDAFVANYQDELGVAPGDLKVEEIVIEMHSEDYAKDYERPTATVVYDQFYKGIPVFNSKLNVSINAYGTVWYVKSGLVKDVTCPSTPVITSQEAIEIAKEHFGRDDLELENPPELLATQRNLIWRLDILGPVYKEVIIDSQNGNVLMEQSNVMT